MFETPNGKGIEYTRDTFGRYRIRFIGGGELPQDLDGQFIYAKDAEAAIHRYLAKAEGKTNGKRVQRKAD